MSLGYSATPCATVVGTYMSVSFDHRYVQRSISDMHLLVAIFQYSYCKLALKISELSGTLKSFEEFAIFKAHFLSLASVFILYPDL